MEKFDDIPSLRNTSKEFQALFGYPNAFRIGRVNQAFEVDSECREAMQCSPPQKKGANARGAGSGLNAKGVRARLKITRERPMSFSGVNNFSHQRKLSLTSEPDNAASIRRINKQNKTRNGSMERRE